MVAPRTVLRRSTLAAAAVCAALWINPAAAKEIAQAAGRAEAVVVTRLSLTKVEDLNFGKIVAGNTAGTIVINPDGTRSFSGGVLAVGNGFNPAAFAGYGFSNQTVQISVGSNTPTIRRVGGTETMRFDTFTIGSAPPTTLTTTPRSFRINSTTGMFAFDLGATLRVGARQVPGMYTGTFSVTISYL
jgi:Domain of unknown function (DUF4402)